MFCPIGKRDHRYCRLAVPLSPLLPDETTHYWNDRLNAASVFQYKAFCVDFNEGYSMEGTKKVGIISSDACVIELCISRAYKDDY